MATIAFELNLCLDCTLHHANDECGNCAWCSDGDDYSNPLPLSALTPEQRHNLALGAHEHQDNCTEEDRREGCDCGRTEFWTFTCGGCGLYTAGNCYDAVVFA